MKEQTNTETCIKCPTKNLEEEEDEEGELGNFLFWTCYSGLLHSISSQNPVLTNCHQSPLTTPQCNRIEGKMGILIQLELPWTFLIYHPV